MQLKMQEKRKEITQQMVTEAIQKDKETEEREVALAMDSDANLPDSSSDEDEFAVGEVEGEEGAAG